MEGDGNMEKLQAFVMGVILMIYGSTASTVDQIAKSANQGEALAVRNWKGEYIGSVQHVLLDSSSGNVAFIILLLYREKREVLIPLRSFSSYDRKNATLVLSVSKEILAAAPDFHLSDLEDPAFAERVHRFFGQVPLWADGVWEGERSI
jgi:hypothetical protein